MPTDQERYEQIERYLAGEMPETERSAFEAALQENPALAETLVLHRALGHSLGNPKRRRLLDALADVAEQEERKKPAGILKRLPAFRLAAAAAVLLLVTAAGVWWYLRPAAESPSIAGQQPPARHQPVPDPARTVRPPAPAVRPAEPGPLASADRKAFEPNRALDPMAGTFVRGGSAALRVTQPENDAVFPLRNGNIHFALDGQIPDEPALTLHIYNNREADFAAGKFLYHADLPVRDQVFTWKSTLRLAPGRYYAVLSVPGEEEPVAVLRFFAGGRK